MDSTEPKVVAVPGVFTRASSGLVRQVSTRDTVYYGAMAITIAYMVFIVTAWPSYPGSSMELATLLVIIGGALLGVVYALFASIYPRSGGEYVFLSRVVHPSVGFVVSFIQAFWYAFYFGLNGAFFAIYGLAPLFIVLGIQWHSSGLTSAGTWFSSHNGIFIMGSLVVLFIGYMVYRGMRGFFRLQRWAGLFALGSVLLTIVLLILGTTGVLHFPANFNAIAGHGAYAAVARAGSVPAFSTLETFYFMVWPAFSILFSVNMVSFSGEVKNFRRGPLIGIVGSMVVTGVLMIVMMYYGQGAFGTRFLQAAPTSPKVPVPPFLNVFASILGNNGFLTILISLWVVFVIPFALGSNVIYSSRAMLAWGLDGVAPGPFANVSERLAHTGVRDHHAGGAGRGGAGHLHLHHLGGDLVRVPRLRDRVPGGLRHRDLLPVHPPADHGALTGEHQGRRDPADDDLRGARRAVHRLHRLPDRHGQGARRERTHLTDRQRHIDRHRVRLVLRAALVPEDQGSGC